MNLYKIVVSYNLIKHSATSTCTKVAYVLAEDGKQALKKLTDKLFITPPACVIENMEVGDIEMMQFTDLSNELNTFIK